jgi:hypothetical protein
LYQEFDDLNVFWTATAPQSNSMPIIDVLKELLLLPPGQANVIPRIRAGPLIPAFSRLPFISAGVK